MPRKCSRPFSCVPCKVPLSIVTTVSMGDSVPGRVPRRRAKVMAESVMHELLALPFSPWSEQAAWALDVSQVPYRYRLYSPLIGEPALRIKTRRWRGNVTVPVLTDERGEVYDDSVEIARFAAARGHGPNLFPVEHERQVLHWIDAAERGLAAGRQ